jgi:hypothetical protein
MTEMFSYIDWAEGRHDMVLGDLHGQLPVSQRIEDTRTDQRRVSCSK